MIVVPADIVLGYDVAVAERTEHYTMPIVRADAVPGDNVVAGR